MALTAMAIAGGVSAAASAGSGIAGLFANNNQAERQFQLQQDNLDLNKQNLTAQQMVQALVNQRAVAGTTDAFGSTTRYDPATNQWFSDLGPLPKAQQTSAIQAGITQNTTDRARIELANQVAAQRASEAAPMADAANRDLASYRPITGTDLTGLLTQQATIANREAYDPLRADVLRSTARTGTAAGPVMAQLGISEAQNLRNSLLDAQVQGMTNAGNINQQRLGNLTSRASTANQLATPNLVTPQIASNDPTNTVQNQLLAAMAKQAGGTTAYGMAGPNAAANSLNSATTSAANAVPNSNLDVTKAQSALSQLGGATGSQNTQNALLAKLFGSGGGGGNPAAAIAQGSQLLNQGLY